MWSHWFTKVSYFFYSCRSCRHQTADSQDSSTNSFLYKLYSNFSVTLAQNRLTLVNRTNNHCVKSVSIWRFSSPYFPMFGLNTERYSAFSSNAGKYGPKNSKY